MYNRYKNAKLTYKMKKTNSWIKTDSTKNGIGRSLHKWKIDRRKPTHIPQKIGPNGSNMIFIMILNNDGIGR